MKDITKSRKSWRVDLNPKIFIFPRIKAKQISCHVPPSRICFLHSTAPTSGQKAQRKWAGRCTGSLWSTHPARFGIRKAIKPTQAPRQQQALTRHRGRAVLGHAGLTPAPGRAGTWLLEVAWVFNLASGRFPRWKQLAVSTSSAAIYEYFNSHKKYITSTLHSWLCGAARGMWTATWFL